MVVNESTKANRSVRPKLKPIDGNNIKVVPKTEKKHRLKQRFEVIKKLGQGTYGKVQLAINKETGQEVAVKTIKKSKVENEQDLIRIKREIQIMSSIQHPHIIHIYEVFENKDKIVLVMQYASGGEVYDYVSHKKVLSDIEARRLFRQIATAIYYCHKNKICHRDLKLENILLDEKGNAKIADFGLSNVFDEKHFLQTFCGSPLYASPEIVKGLPYYGPEVDCWSLGVLLYTLVYGAMPFDGSNFKKLVKQITESNYFEPKQKSDASELIKRLLAPNPTKRATIIDICTDWWVNLGYEHSLLQVAEDMANLTPVRLEILLALAPVSPSADNTLTNPFSAIEVQKNESKEKTNENIDDLGESMTDINTTESISKKRNANPSFDQSLSTIPTQTPKKKKTKNESQNKCEETKIKKTGEGDNIENNQSVVENNDNKNNYQILSNLSQSNEIQNEVNSNSDSITKQELPEIINDLNSLSKTEDKVCSEVEDLTHLAVNKRENISDEIKVESNKTESTNNEIESIPNEQIVESNDTKESKEKELQLINDLSSKVENNSESDAKSCQIESKLKEDSEEIKIESKTEEKKTKPERRMSAKRPGKLSIPNIWNKSIDLTESQSKTDIKNKSQVFETKGERKVPFIPVGFRVSDAKRAFERRCSVPANNLLISVNSFNKINRDSEIVCETEEKKNSNIRQRIPKLNSRSMSCNEMLESPKKVQEFNNKVQESIHNKEVKTNQNTDTITSTEPQSDETMSQQICSTEVSKNELMSSPVVDKNMAKDILKKTIAKAKLNQKKNSSDSLSCSPVTTPLVSIENSDVSILSEPSFFRKVRPFVKEEPDRPVIETDIKVDIKSKNEENLKNVINDSMADTNNAVNQSITSEVIPNSQELDEPNKNETNVETKSTPIARSYKKVTFTKDGACITETGKIYSSEGIDGSFTRVEKKSKVTHFPSIETQTKNNEDSLQRSDSHSSSGSLDIFDDIFDNHWCGDEVIFPNMKSLLQGVIGNRKTRRRSRAESCERNASDWFGLKKTSSNISDQEIEDDDYESFFSRSFRPTSRTNTNTSLFDRSLFSKHFKDIDREFGELDNSYRDLNRSVSRDRSSFSSRIHPTSFKIVFGPQTSVRTTKSITPFDTEGDDYESASMAHNSRNRSTDNLKTWSREPDSLFSERNSSNLRKFDSFDSPRKRVEQWLQSDNNDDNNEETDIRSGPLSMYATIGPRGVRRYLRTMSGRSNDRPNTESINSSSSVGVLRTNSSSHHSNAVHSIQSTIPNNSVLEMRFSINPSNTESNSKLINTNTDTQTTCDTSDCSDEYQSSIAIPESSSLLEQLRTHGYRNIVSQRLSGSSLFSDLDSNLTENDKNYKRGKSVLNCSSNIANENENACECMGQTNIKVTSSATTSEAAVATDLNANNNNESKASETLKFANRIDLSKTISETLNNSLNQQSSESTTRSSSRNSSINSKTTVTDDLPECNPTLKPKITTNKSVNFKESVQERIHRKSFYSRFNDDRPVLSSRHRRRSFIDSDDVDIALGIKSHLSRRTNSFRNSLSLEDNNSILSKPPSSSSDWFTRMESKASQLMDDLLINDRMRSLHSRSSLNSFENCVSFDSRRRSASTTRSALSTPLPFKSDFDSYFNSISSPLNINEENQTQNDLNSMENIRSTTEVLQKAIDILSQTDIN